MSAVVFGAACLNFTKSISPSTIILLIECLDRAIVASEENLSTVIQKANFWETQQAIALNERQRKMLNKLIDGMEGKLTSSKWAKINQCSPDTALRDIQDLVDKNILEKEEGGGRSTSYRLRS